MSRGHVSETVRARLPRRRVSIWRHLLFGDLRAAESRIEAAATTGAVESSAHTVEAETAVPQSRSRTNSGPGACRSRTASGSNAELQGPTYPAPTPKSLSESKTSSIEMQVKKEKMSRSPSATSQVRIARVSDPVPDRRRSSLSAVVTYVKDLVVGRCLCRNGQNDHSARVAMLHADPLVSVDATQYAPGKEIPVDLEIPSLPSERHTFEQISDKCPAEIDILFKHLSIMSLGEELSSTERIRLLHLSAHGTKTPEGKYALVMENECGFADFCLMSRLRKLMKSCTVPECVVISACYSELAASVFISAGAKHVIACRRDQRVMDQAARYFNRFFYMALFNGHTVRRAFLIAKANVAAVVDADTPEVIEQAISSDPALNAAMREDGRAHNRQSSTVPSSIVIDEEESGNEFSVDEDSKISRSQSTVPALDLKAPVQPPPKVLESEKFVLLPADADHDVVLFPTPRKLPRGFSRSRSDRRRISRTHTPMSAPRHPPVPAYALGRHVHVSRCISLLQVNRCVNIVGRQKIGKSTIAFMCISYVSDRLFFSDGVFYVDMNAVKRMVQQQIQLEEEDAGADAVPGRVVASATRRTMFFNAFLKAMGLNSDPTLRVSSFEELFQAMSHWHCLLVLDNVNSARGADIAEQLLRITHKPKVLLTSNMAVDLGEGILRQVVVAKELSYGSSRELVRILAPWKNEESIHSLIQKTRGCPGSIHSALESEFKTGHVARVH